MPSKPKASNIQNGSLVWIIYRKQPWPVLVKRLYPKKMTYNFLPVSKHPVVFSTPLKNVRLFLPSDQLPSGATEDQQEAFDVAMEMVTKSASAVDHTSSSSAESATEDAAEVVEEPPKPAVKRATTGKTQPVAAVAKKPPFENIDGSTESSDDGDTADEAFVDYAPGDVAIVDTSRGSWPVQVKEVVDEKSAIIYELFPPSSAAQGRVAVDKVQRFPADDIETLIAGSKGHPNLYKAFQNVKAYMTGEKAEAKPVETTEDQNEEKEDEEEEPPRPKRGKNITKPVAKSSASKSVVERKVASNGDGAKTATSSSAGKKKAAEKKAKKEEKMEVESKRTTRKRRHDVDGAASNEEEKAKGEDEAELSPDSSADHVAKKRNGRGEPASLAVAAVTKEKRRINAAAEDVRPDSTISVAQANGKFSSALKELPSIAPSTTVTRRRLGMNRAVAAEEPIVEPVATPASKPKAPDFLQTLLSLEASAYMNAIWAGERKAMRIESSAYTPPTTVDGMDVRFQPFGRFFAAADELHDSVTEIRKWTQLCTKLPKMTLLTELHYIASVVLPEACIFALSKIKQCSLSDAADKFERMISDKSRDNNKEKTDADLVKSNTVLGNGNDSTTSGSGNSSVEPRNGSSATNSAGSNGKPANGGLDELVRAAGIMARSAGDGAATLAAANKSLNFNSSSEGAMYIVEED